MPPQRKTVMSHAFSMSRAGSTAAPEQHLRPDTAPAVDADSADMSPAADTVSPTELTSTSSSDGSSAVSQEVPSEPMEGAVSAAEAEQQHSAAGADAVSVSAPAAEVRFAG